jgi:arylformamidase
MKATLSATRSSLVVALLALVTISFASAQNRQGSLRQRLAQRRAARQEQDADTQSSKITLPAGVKLVKDVRYGNDKLQTFDAYIPANAKNSPVIFMVHGGGWRDGDKTNARVVQNKLNHFAALGYIFISVNNRLLPTTPTDQAVDVAHALATAQKQAAQWNGDPNKFVLMGHSAGAHLVDLVSAAPRYAKDADAKPWLATVSLDAGAIDVEQIMTHPHFPLYDDAFGKEKAYWQTASPLMQLSAAVKPMLLVCSSQRRESCPANHEFATKAKKFGSNVSVLEEPLSHGEINMNVGLPGAYTDAVDKFVASVLKP